MQHGESSIWRIQSSLIYNSNFPTTYFALLLVDAFTCIGPLDGVPTLSASSLN
jgi:hypothetical protein